MRPLLLLLLLLFGNTALRAQSPEAEIQIGYIAPFGTHIGAFAGYASALKNRDSVPTGRQQWWWQLQGGYFMQHNVSNTVFMHPELQMRKKWAEGRFCFFISVGSSFFYTIRKQEGTLDLANGKVSYQKEGEAYIVPRLSLGVGSVPRKRWGGFFRVSYGRQWGINETNQAFFGGAAGIILSTHQNHNP